MKKGLKVQYIEGWGVNVGVPVVRKFQGLKRREGPVM
jgi:hypothetical protein